MISFRLSSRPAPVEKWAGIGLALAGIFAANLPIYVDDISYLADTVSVLAPILGAVATVWILPRLFSRGILSAFALAIGGIVLYVATFLLSVAFSMSQL